MTTAFPTSEKVYQRIKWDPSIRSDRVTLHYTDRVHQKLLDCAFMDWSTAEIPWHRVQEIRYQNQIVWDRSNRTYQPELLRDLNVEEATNTDYLDTTQFLGILNRYKLINARSRKGTFYLCGSRGLGLPECYIDPETDWDFLYVGSYWHDQEAIKAFLHSTGLFRQVHRIENPVGLIIKAKMKHGNPECQFQFWNPERSREKAGTAASNMLTEPKYWFKQISKTQHTLYRECLGYIKKWAKTREIYGQSYGFLSGMSWNLLVTFIWISAGSSQPTSLSEFVDRFFKTYSQWDWDEPVRLIDNGFYSEGDTGSPHMSIFLATSPRENTVRNVTSMTKKIILQQIQKGVEKPPETWSFDSHLYRVELSCDCEDLLHDAVDYVKRFIPELLIRLEEQGRSYRPRTIWEYTKMSSGSRDASSSASSSASRASWDFYGDDKVVGVMGIWLEEHGEALPKSVNRKLQVFENTL